jgi:hypothetical protein
LGSRPCEETGVRMFSKVSAEGSLASREAAPE